MQHHNVITATMICYLSRIFMQKFKRQQIIYNFSNYLQLKRSLYFDQRIYLTVYWFLQYHIAGKYREKVIQSIYGNSNEQNEQNKTTSALCDHPPDFHAAKDNCSTKLKRNDISDIIKFNFQYIYNNHIISLDFACSFAFHPHVRWGFALFCSGLHNAKQIRSFPRENSFDSIVRFNSMLYGRSQSTSLYRQYTD